MCDDVTDGVLDFEPGSEGFLRLKSGDVPIIIESFRRTPKGVLYKLSGIDDRSAAEGVKGAGILTLVETLPALDEDEFYAYELDGLPVYDDDGDLIGRVTGFIETAGSDILVIDRDGSEYLVPLARAHVVSVSPGDRIIIRDIPWE